MFKAYFQWNTRISIPTQAQSAYQQTGTGLIREKTKAANWVPTPQNMVIVLELRVRAR